MSQEPLTPTLGEVLEKAKFLISKLAGWQGVDLTQLDEDYDGAITAIWNASQEARDDAAELRAAAQEHLEPDTRLAWHFLRGGGRLRTGEVAPPDGEWLVHDGPVEPCKSGLHASERLQDALNYVPVSRPVLCRVEVRGNVVEHGAPVDKLAASERRILWRLDEDTTEGVLQEFARWCAAQVIHLWDAPEVVRQFLATGDERLRAASWAASWDAARDAAWAAAWAAARAAAWAAARDAAWAAARAAAGYTAENAQNTELERLANAASEGQP